MPSVIELAEAVRRGERSAREVLGECLSAIERHNPALNAFVHLDVELANRAAAAVDAAVARREDPGPLAGVPFGVKDLEDCAGMPTSYGSLLYKGRPAVTSDSIHVARLRAAGAVPVGKTAAPEFGNGCFTRTKAWGTTRNPWDLQRTPGGSSGGSAAAVAAGMVPFGTAGDGGGSIRIPAAFCGLVGFKSSYGRIPDPGNTIRSETNCPGALTTTVVDAARHLDVAAGPDDRDRLSLPSPLVNYERAIEELDVSGLRAGWSPDLGFAVVEPEVAAAAWAAAETLVQSAGLRLVEVEPPATNSFRVWLQNSALDMWQDLEPGMWPARTDELVGLVRSGLRRSEGMTLPRYARAIRRRQEVQDEVARLFRGIDVLVTPTTAIPAFGAEDRIPMEVAGQDVPDAGPVPFTMLGNLCGLPAVSVPAGTTADGLPIGLQIVARRMADEVALRLARVLELARPWPRLAPGFG